MKNFWALPAFLRMALASPHTFSVFDDLLAFPQYEVLFENSFISENDAAALLSQGTSRSTSSATPRSQETQELSHPTKQSPGSPPSEAALEETYEPVVLGGQRFLCSIPVIPEDTTQSNTTSAEEAKAEEEKELVRATDRGWQLLEGMQGNCIYYLSGWWSYSFCYKDEVKQFHQLPPSRGVPIYPPVEDTSVKSFVLGKFSDKERKGTKEDVRKTLGTEQGSKQTLDDEGNQKEDEKGLELPRLETKGSSRYMVQRLSGGTECDLTGRERKIEVQFHCHPQSSDKISMIKETSTCSYLMVIYTPRLCNDVAFQPPQENFAHPISCQPVIPDSQVDDWTIARIEDQIRENEQLVEDIEAENPLRAMEPGAEGNTPRGAIIGGIEVGAQSLVGSEGKAIEKSVVVGGGKETYIGTVASSDGKQMSKEELKRLDIMDPADVDKLKKNLRKLAGKKGWKLDLVDTPRGKEFRGIIEAEDQDEIDAKKEKGQEKEKDQEKDQEKGRGMGSGKEDDKGNRRKAEQEEEEGQEGSQEVYKDEL